MRQQKPKKQALRVWRKLGTLRTCCTCPGFWSSDSPWAKVPRRGALYLDVVFGVATLLSHPSKALVFVLFSGARRLEARGSFRCSSKGLAVLKTENWPCACQGQLSPRGQLPWAKSWQTPRHAYALQPGLLECTLGLGRSSGNSNINIRQLAVQRMRIGSRGLAVLVLFLAGLPCFFIGFGPVRSGIRFVPGSEACAGIMLRGLQIGLFELSAKRLGLGSYQLSAHKAALSRQSAVLKLKSWISFRGDDKTVLTLLRCS